MDQAYVATRPEEDRGHWWFGGRRAVILATLRRTLTPGLRRLLDLGWGSGNVLEALGQLGRATGMEADPALASAARAAGLDGRAGLLSDGRVVPAGRRYTACGLRAAVEAAGLRVRSLSYFNTLLFPALALVRGLKRLRGDEGHDRARPSALLNGLLAGVFGLEAARVPRCPMPYGASLIVVGRR